MNVRVVAVRDVAVVAAVAAPGIDVLFEISLALLDGGPRADAGVQRESQQSFVSIPHSTLYLVRGGGGNNDVGEEEHGAGAPLDCRAED